jgi:hypothetical protein
MLLDGNEADLVGPAVLEHDAVEIHVGMLALDRPLAPGLNRSVIFLLSYGTADGDTRVPHSGLGDTLDPTNRDPAQIYLDQGLLDPAVLGCARGPTGWIRFPTILMRCARWR